MAEEIEVKQEAAKEKENGGKRAQWQKKQKRSGRQSVTEEAEARRGAAESVGLVSSMCAVGA